MKTIIINYDETIEGCVEGSIKYSKSPALTIMESLFENVPWKVEIIDNMEEDWGLDDPPPDKTLVITYDEVGTKKLFESHEVCQGGISIPTRMMSRVRSYDDLDKFIIDQITLKMQRNNCIKPDSITYETECFDGKV